MTEGTLLAFDTSGPLGSVAVARDGRVRARRFLPRRGQHGSHLIPAVDECLREAEAEPTGVDGLVVGAGPGSFTGIRVAVATARGLARSLGAPIYGFPSLMAAAVADVAALPPSEELPSALRWPEDAPGRFSPKELPRMVLFDARADRAYAAAYRLSGGRLHAVREPAAVTVGEVLDEDLPAGTVFCGDGALRHRSVIREAGFRVAPPPLGVPTADGLLHLLQVVPDAGPVKDPRRWTPEYLRPVAARPTMDPSAPNGGDG